MIHLLIIHVLDMYLVSRKPVECGLDALDSPMETPMFYFFYHDYRCAIITVPMRFLSPGIHKQWTIPAYLLAKLLLLYTPCISESTHLKFNQSLVKVQLTTAMDLN
jgi:hypothetical protein